LDSGPSETTRLLLDLSRGDPQIRERIFDIVYDELRHMAHNLFRRERPGQTLEPTALVHEAYLKLIDQTRVRWQNRAHFFAIAAQVMRRILVDRAREKAALRRGAHLKRISLDVNVAVSQDRPEDVLLINEVIQRLGGIDSRQAQILEMRFFGGLTVEEVAEVLQVSRRTIEAEWTMIRAQVRRYFSETVE
jgi:RNA polymerase sigma-70 factor, ECF subfamily